MYATRSYLLFERAWGTYWLEFYQESHLQCEGYLESANRLRALVSERITQEDIAKVFGIQGGKYYVKTVLDPLIQDVKDEYAVHPERDFLPFALTFLKDLKREMMNNVRAMV